MPNPRPIRVDDDVWEALNALPGKSVNEKLRLLLIDTAPAVSVTVFDREDFEPSRIAICETLELVRSLPSVEDIEAIVDATMQRKIEERAASRPPASSGGAGYNPASIPGVHVAGDMASRSMRNTGGEMVPTTRENGDKIPYAEQQEIARNQHQQREAEKDSTAQATGRSDIEYDPNWGG